MMPPTCTHACGMRLASMLLRQAPTAREGPSCRLERRRPREARLPAAAAAPSGDSAPQHGVPDLASAPHFGASMPQQKHEERVSRPAAETAELARWQRKRLETAYQAGKRSISVKQLAGDTKLDRKQVLAWLKDRAQQPFMPADQDRGGAGPEIVDQPLSHNEPAATVDPPKTTARRSFAERQAEPGGDFARKRMKRSTEMTLEKVYDRYRWPSDEIIAGICTLHREMSPGRVKLWFEEQRRLQSPQQSSHRH